MAIKINTTIELSPEDSLRLNVLLKQTLRAVRIDEPSMIVYALTDQGEAKVPLNPTCREDRYLRQIRELLSYNALGKPGGYPVFLDRWTRTEHSRDDESLDAMLLLGEPEAIVAIAHSPGLSEQRARKVWWALPTVDVARRLLGNENVVSGKFGKELAAFLVEHLPFESEPSSLVNTVQLVLQGELIDEQTKLQLWSRGKRKHAYLVGFLQAIPDQLPAHAKAHNRYAQFERHCNAQIKRGNLLAQQLLRLFSAAGQLYLGTLHEALQKLPNQEVAVYLFNAMDQYMNCFEHVRHFQAHDLSATWQQANTWVGQTDHDEVADILQADSDYAPYLAALMTLSSVGEKLLDPVFAQTDAIGSVMRKRMEPLTATLNQIIKTMQR